MNAKYASAKPSYQLMQGEEWKDVIEDFQQISTEGRMRILDYEGGGYIWDLMPTVTTATGDVLVSIFNEDGSTPKRITKSVKALVANAWFIAGEGDCLGFIDGNKSNVRLANLYRYSRSIDASIRQKITIKAKELKGIKLKEFGEVMDSML